MRIIATALCALLAAVPTRAEETMMTPPPAATHSVAARPAATPAVLRDLAPTGRLRAAINLGNPVLARADGQGADEHGADVHGAGEPGGVSVDLARALAKELGVPVAFVTYPTAGAVSGSAGSGAWDVCFLAIDPKRAEEIAFTAPYVLIAGSYLVPDGSPIASTEAVDRAGVRVSVGRGSAYDLFLSRELKHASLVRAPTSAEALDAFGRGGLDVAAGVHQPLAAYAAAHPGVRLLPGHFMEIPQAMGLPVGREAGAAYLAAFVARMKASGLVARSLADNRQDPGLAAP